MNKLPIDQQVALFMQGTEYGDDTLRQAMQSELLQRLTQASRSGRALRVYCGFDPRTSDLHLGHTIPMRKLRQFQEQDHEVIFVIGRFTSLIGDPSDKDKVRAQMTLEDARRNAESYAEQAFRILDRDRTRIEYNDTWLSQLKFRDLIQLASNFTVQQFLTRETFRKRWDENDPIFLHETFYAIMQGFDAFHLKADVQVGGSDQLFNIITAARKLMDTLGEPPNIGIIMGILPGTDGVIRMSKSLGNHIPLNAVPEDMYGKVMSVPDIAMGQYARLVTRWSPAQIEGYERKLKSGALHPRDLKMHLAREIVSIYHGEDSAGAAEEAFRTVFQEQGEPQAMAEFRLTPDQTALEVLVATGLADSKSEARRLIAQQGVHLGDDLLDDPNLTIEVGESAVLRVGKRRFVRLLPPD